ncbi:hypothetical protein [Zhongshania aquimaris]|uniref:Uncharacterized protein n=1 Tax=Zhongshania aquimaris TaxID=2857107 RepID=A0ABS6VU98_9GAMM|nr:hypothetical protein [Zhongshania aquimaris]MBW2941573.1 hypothetical protein [Zhongshania aquimaris]
MTDDIEYWLKRLADPAACESPKERAVMEAVRSGLRAADSLEQTDELALKRLHQRLASEGLYEETATPSRSIPRSKRLQFVGYAAVLLVGVSLVLNYAVTDKPLHEAALQESEARFSKAESTKNASPAFSNAMIAEEREATMQSDTAGRAGAEESPAAMAAPAKPQALSSRPKEKDLSEYRAQGFAADMAESRLIEDMASEAENAAHPVRLTLNLVQWQALLELNPEVLSLSKGDEEGSWILVLYDEAAKEQWLAKLPEASKDGEWPIDVELNIEVIISDD